MRARAPSEAAAAVAAVAPGGGGGWREGPPGGVQVAAADARVTAALGRAEVGVVVVGVVVVGVERVEGVAAAAGCAEGAEEVCLQWEREGEGRGGGGLECSKHRMDKLKELWVRVTSGKGEKGAGRSEETWGRRRQIEEQSQQTTL